MEMNKKLNGWKMLEKNDDSCIAYHITYLARTIRGWSLLFWWFIVRYLLDKMRGLKKATTYGRTAGGGKTAPVGHAVRPAAILGAS